MPYVLNDQRICSCRIIKRGLQNEVTLNKRPGDRLEAFGLLINQNTITENNIAL